MRIMNAKVKFEDYSHFFDARVLGPNCSTYTMDVANFMLQVYTESHRDGNDFPQLGHNLTPPLFDGSYTAYTWGHLHSKDEESSAIEDIKDE